MINYAEIWASVNRESEANPDSPRIARKIPSTGIFSAYLATEFSNGLRILYIKLVNGYDLINDKLPEVRGLEYNVERTTVGKSKNKDFLVFKQTIPNTQNVFEIFISDLCDTVLGIQRDEDLYPTLHSVLSEWKLFFEKKQSDILPIEKQKGLFGELHFLKNYLLDKYSVTNALSYWTGTSNTNHDFQINSVGVEIKTTSSKQHKKFTIASERQLDGFGLDHLYLVLYNINVHGNLPANNLPAMISSIELAIADQPAAVFHLQLKLSKAGYKAEHAGLYQTGFSLNETKTYEVTEGFPRLLANDLPNGVGDLKYSVMASACAAYELQTDILNLI